MSQGNKDVWDRKFIITNSSDSFRVFVTPLGQEIQKKSFLEFYSSKNKSSKKLPFVIKKTLPVIKTLEGLVYIPHLNIYNDIKIKTLVNVENIDYCSVFK